MSNSGLTSYQDELLTILMEECGETIQEICKIMRFGFSANSHHIPDSNHLACLEQELGDIIAMIELVRGSNIGITTSGLELAKQRKLTKVSKWIMHKKDNLPPAPKVDAVLAQLEQSVSLSNKYKKVDNTEGAIKAPATLAQKELNKKEK